MLGASVGAFVGRALGLRLGRCVGPCDAKEIKRCTLTPFPQTFEGPNAVNRQTCMRMAIGQTTSPLS